MSRSASAAAAAKRPAKKSAERRTSAKMPKVQAVAADAALTVWQAARSLLKQELKQFEKHLLKCIDRWRKKPDHLHQTRISARRLQQHLELLGPLLGKDRSLRWLRKHLKSLLKASSPARDLDVLLHHAAAKKTSAAVCQQWQQQRCRLQKPLREIQQRLSRPDGLKQHRRALLKAISRSACRESSAALANSSASGWAVEQATVRLAELQTALPASSSSKSLHRFRLLVKQHRYQAELLLQLSGHPIIQRLVQCLLQVQKQLGRLQDAVVAARSLKKVTDNQKKSAGKKKSLAKASQSTAEIAAESSRLLTWLQSDIAPQLNSLARRLQTPSGRRR
ncbi:MAG: CHAD domain-containing protein [Planctomyces sp.]